MKKISFSEIGWVAAIFILIWVVQIILSGLFYVTGMSTFGGNQQIYNLSIHVIILQAIIAGLVVEVWIKKKDSV